ncbi:dephospho-CoA kinase [Bartonella tamiae]|uniref:Dephospho-CoA kinase n=1 Tax=Bartonella tamiae Th239 TaxID=1094558 RepID=J0R5N3_9HYPH|nr:dephospho-CoA kinase [Bartonella tamiae]EJF90984.1 dephospho-CoA kinase [Bartonella tamiae Th239]EJF93351.1 dephospho-CoA kinase [Bartonella tamiae Th307]
MIILGLTGSIGMGKTTTANFFKSAGIPVYSADATVHELYKSEPATRLVEAAFPGTVTNDEVDRKKLSQILLSDQQNFKILERIIHPLVRKKERDFITMAKNNHEPLIVLDIPLLFETKAEERVDKILVVSAPFDVQRERVLTRQGMDEKKFYMILANQMSDEDKRARADYVIDTSNGFECAQLQVLALIQDLKNTSSIL